MRTRSSPRRVDRQVVGSRERDGSDDSISQEHVSKDIDDFSAVGNIADTSSSQCENEDNAFVVKQISCVSVKKLTRTIRPKNR